MIHNAYIYKEWESDFLWLTFSDIAHEYEIKTSVADFKNDVKKEMRHTILTTGIKPLTDKKTILYYQNHKKYGKLISRNGIIMQRPNYFWYVVPEGLVDKNDVPDHAGLRYVSKDRVFTVKTAPKLHKKRINEETKMRLIYALSYKYWNLKGKKH